MWIKLERKNNITLSSQIYNQIRHMIHNGTLPAGYKLPSTRKLASHLSVSRNTVLEAYNQLLAEGYLKTYKGSGTVVENGLSSFEFAKPIKQNTFSAKKYSPSKKEIIDFRTGVPALEYFPRKEWGNMYKEKCNTIPPSGFGYCSASGVWELREAINDYLYRARGISCNPHQIVITSGSTQSLSLLSHILRDNRKMVYVENPTHPGLRNVISSADCKIEGISVDESGLCTEQLVRKKHTSFVYTTPSHQYPMGSILSIQRRLELVRYAKENDCYIVEDDYDSEFRFEGSPVSALYELDPQRVIYCGSFSKILAPAIRLGFAVLPKELLAEFKMLKTYSDVHTDSLGQHTLAAFIRSGGFEKHIWKMKKRYANNRALLLNELSKHFPKQIDVLGHATGLHVVVRFRDTIFSKKIINVIVDNNVKVYPIGDFYIKENQMHNDKIILGYSHLTPEKIIKGIEILSNILH